MKVFISWSGDKSRDVAQVLHDWLPLVLHSVEPFVSSKDIRAGTRWQAEIASELDDTDFGLICVTRHNLSAEWLNFEAGALAKAVDSSRVVPIAIDLSPAEVPNPLGQFQATTLDKPDIAEILRSMNDVCSPSIPEINLAKTFDRWWPDLEHGFREIRQRDYGGEDEPASPERSEREMIEEVLDSVRGLARGGGDSARARSQTSDLFEEIEEVAHRNGSSLASISNTGHGFSVRFMQPPTPRLVRDLAELEKRSGEFILPSFPPISSGDGISKEES